MGAGCAGARVRVISRLAESVATESLCKSVVPCRAGAVQCSAVQHQTRTSWYVLGIQPGVGRTHQ